MFQYDAKLVRVVDGDTVYLDVDLGFRVHVTLDLRLLGINAPEMVGTEKAAAIASKAELEHLLSLGKIRIWTQKQDKYGRWLAKIGVFLPDEVLLDVNKTMIDGGFARPYNP